MDFAEEDRKKEDAFELENSVFKKNLTLLNEFEDEASNKKRHEIIKESINNVKELGVIKLFKFLSFFWVAIVITLVSLQMDYTAKFWNNTNTLIDLLLDSNKERTLVSKLTNLVYDVEFLEK